MSNSHTWIFYCNRLFVIAKRAEYKCDKCNKKQERKKMKQTSTYPIIIKDKLDNRLHEAANKENITINNMIVALMEYGLSQWPKPDVKAIIAKYEKK